ncbi:TPA: PP2C family protein-serine/threonine phosphatase [Vibrio parahaemolyticus]|uniref:PP2C family protein-serine/threonine phosphatase n=1 Tax=Vibrio parahaemolyticus TaxID=670 RepID=UPI00215B9CC3|nr:protein phosphatase 2C domain-containing protein [Vibrio parahaemolyticus]MCS0044153.1 protein phosphatase 2C domain-containing protein [Vibrio parahaemolyticus]MDF5342750.1 protein phosphatase 2C domain-containing protein [Vibrio parahaemolyticus]HCH4277780.1 protein phosphatase 2C domain-containing protein [Vibrio parahaemolyticus]HCH4282196.1 protein phosphatase 2C domain-containing protein [Vibrio parahaemolyticus]
MFQELLQKHLARGVLSRGLHSIDSGAIAIASDLGLRRTENQDRAAVMKFRSPTALYTLVAVVDGMGGMRDGEQAAELAISTFFNSVMESIHLGSEQAITQATLAANNAVFAFANGKGGSTLSALLLCSDDVNVTVNVGDSRIYAKDSVLSKLVRLSVDDSLAEAVGGSGTELLQFIGMGEGIKPHVAPLKSEISQVYLTTDGVHYIEPKTLSDIVENAGRVNQIVERLIATARWCGGPDNASICAVDLELLTFEEHVDDTTVIQVSDPYTSMQFIWGHSPVDQQAVSHVSNQQINIEEKTTKVSNADELDNSVVDQADDEEPSDAEQKADSQEQLEAEPKTANKERPKRKSRTSKKKVDKKDSDEEVQIKMTICDDVSDDNGEVNNDSSN